MKTQKGITLIALIITIIVMLILVGISVSVALNTGLFKTAQGAAKNTEGARVNETKLSEGQIQKQDGTWVDIKEYADSFKSEGLDLSGEVGTQVAYSAGDITDWRILSKDETAGTVTILGKTTISDWSAITTEENLISYLREQYTNPDYVDFITNVHIIEISNIIDIETFIGDCTSGSRDLTFQEEELLSMFGLEDGSYLDVLTGRYYEGVVEVGCSWGVSSLSDGVIDFKWAEVFSEAGSDDIVLVRNRDAKIYLKHLVKLLGMYLKSIIYKTIQIY